MKIWSADMWGEMNLQGGDIGVKEMTSPAVGRNSSFAIALENLGISAAEETRPASLRFCTVSRECASEGDARKEPIQTFDVRWFRLSDETVWSASVYAWRLLHKRFRRYLPK